MKENIIENIRQVNIDCYGCEGNLNDKDGILDIMQKAAIETGAKVIGQNAISYPVHGITAVVFLAESHILVSTYPEIKYSVLEVFMCNEKVSPDNCAEIILKFLKPQKTIKNVMNHAISSTYPVVTDINCPQIMRGQAGSNRQPLA